MVAIETLDGNAVFAPAEISKFPVDVSFGIPAIGVVSPEFIAAELDWPICGVDGVLWNGWLIVEEGDWPGIVEVDADWIGIVVVGVDWTVVVSAVVQLAL